MPRTSRAPAWKPEEGEEVVAFGVNGLKDGTRVRVDRLSSSRTAGTAVHVATPDGVNRVLPLANVATPKAYRERRAEARREKQAAGGKRSVGPRAPTKGLKRDRVSASGYKMPDNGYRGSKHAARNAEIHRRVKAGEDPDALAKKFKVKRGTVLYIARYFRPSKAA